MTTEDPSLNRGIVELLDSLDSVAVSAYREAVRLHLYYASSPYSVRPKPDKKQADRWKESAHRILRSAIENILKAQ